MDWMILGASFIRCSSRSCCDVSSLMLHPFYAADGRNWQRRRCGRCGTNAADSALRGG